MTPAAPFQTVNQSGGTLDGSADLIAQDKLAWSGGTMQGSGETIGYGVNTLTGTVLLLDRTVALSGSSTWTSTIDGGSGTLVNTSGGVLHAAVGTLSGTFDNYGVFTGLTNVTGDLNTYGIYQGTANVTGTMTNSGTLKPTGLYGQTTATINVTGAFIHHNNGTLHFDLSSSAYDQIVVEPGAGGSSSATTVTLGASAVFHIGDTIHHQDYTLIENVGGAIDGLFSTLPEGEVLLLDDIYYAGSYLGTDGDGFNAVLDPSPTVEDDQGYSTPKSEELVLSPTLFENDFDDDDMTVVIVTEPQYGSVTVNGTEVTYTPNGTYVGTDTFTYRAADWLSESFETATVSIDVTNQAPVTYDDYYTTIEDGSVFGNVLMDPTADADPDEDDLTASVTGWPLNGYLVYFDSDGSFGYVPYEDFNGTDAFTYAADDGYGGVTPATAYITVLPVNDDPEQTEEEEDVPPDSAFSGTMQAYFHDVDGDTLTYTVISSPSVGGTLVMAADGSYVFTPMPGYFGPVTFVIRVDDGSGRYVTYGFTFFVNAPPEVADDTYDTRVGELVYASVLANDFDANDDRMTVAIADDAEHGDVTLLGNGLFIYKPDAEWFGTDSFTYMAADGRGGTGLGTVTISVQEGELPPPVGGYNGNDGAAQRSRLTTIALEFTEAVDASTLMGLGGIILTRTAALTPMGIGTIVQTGASGNQGRVTVTQNNTRSITLTFDNADGADVSSGVEYGSLADGRWLLAIPSLGFHTTVGDTNLRRLFGDINNDGTVDGTDLQVFASAYGTYAGQQSFNAAFDFNNDGIIDGTDFNHFGNRFGLVI